MIYEAGTFCRHTHGPKMGSGPMVLLMMYCSHWGQFTQYHWRMRVTILSNTPNIEQNIRYYKWYYKTKLLGPFGMSRSCRVNPSNTPSPCWSISCSSWWIRLSAASCSFPFILRQKAMEEATDLLIGVWRCCSKIGPKHMILEKWQTHGLCLLCVLWVSH